MVDILWLRSFGEAILAIIYDIHVESHEDVFVQNAEKAINAAQQAAIPGHFLVDVFPIRWLPSSFSDYILTYTL
jgi:hypothetical protein